MNISIRYKTNLHRFFTMIFISFLFCNFIIIGLYRPKLVKADAVALGALSAVVGTSTTDGVVSGACLLQPEIGIPLATCLIAGGVVFQNRDQIAKFSYSCFNYLKNIGQDIGSGFVKTASGAYQMTATAKSSVLSYIAGVKGGSITVPNIPLLGSFIVPAGGQIVWTNIVVPYSLSLSLVYLNTYSTSTSGCKDISYAFKTDGYTGVIQNSGYGYNNTDTGNPISISFTNGIKFCDAYQTVTLPTYGNSYIGLRNGSSSINESIGISMGGSVPASILSGVASNPTYSQNAVLSSKNPTVCVPTDVVNWDNFVGVNSTTLKDKVATKDVVTGDTTGTFPSDVKTDTPSSTTDYTPHLTGIKSILQGIGDFLKGIPEAVFNAFKSMLQLMLDALGAIKSGILTLNESICAIPKEIGKVLEVPFTGVRDAIGAVGSKIGSIVGDITGFFVVDWDSVLTHADYSPIFARHFKVFYDTTYMLQNIKANPKTCDGKFYMKIPHEMGGDDAEHCVLDLSVGDAYIQLARNVLKFGIWMEFIWYVLKLFSPKFNIT